MRLYDISVPLSARTPTYPGDPGIKIQPWRELANGDAANVSVIYFGAHSGTHIDAPAHFIRGAAKLESLPLDVLIGRAQVLEVPPDQAYVDREFIEKNVTKGTERVLFKTRNSRIWENGESEFRKDYVYVDLKAANRMVELGIRLVGIDYLSIEKFESENHETHLCFLSQGIVIVEGLNLAQVSAGIYELICLPLRIADGDGDGAPARAVLREL